MAYRKAMVTYLDILGFSELIEKSRKDSGMITKIQNDLISLKTKSSQGGLTLGPFKGEPEQTFYSYNFSDLTVRCSLLPDDVDLDHCLGWELLYVGVTQEKLLRDRILLRGGICLGEIAVQSDGIVFGPALVKAYRLESEYAVYPRVAIDRLLINEVRKQLGTKYRSDFVHQGDDGTYFLDYLFGAAMFSYELQNPKTSPSDVFTGHREVVVEKLQTGIGKDAPRTRQKNMWLARYHNSSLDRFGERMRDVGKEFELSQMTIGEELLDF